MKVVRYMFDICMKSDADVYTMASVVRKAIMNADGVLGCEAKDEHAKLVNSVYVDKIIENQNKAGKLLWLDKG